MTKQERIIDYLSDWRNCQRCNLFTPSRKGLAFGEGDPNSRILFVGEWPKDQVSEASGAIMTPKGIDLFFKSLEFFGTTPKDVFLVPVLSCRPVDSMGTTNKPTARQLSSCRPRLDYMLEIIDPLVVVLIGQKAFNAYGKNDHNKFTYANLCSDPRPFEVVNIGSSGAEIRRSALVIRPFDWILEKDPSAKSGGQIEKMLTSLQIAFAILDNHNSILYGEERPARKEVIDL